MARELHNAQFVKGTAFTRPRRNVTTKQRTFRLAITAAAPHCDVAVLGAGAAGLTAAYFAASSGAKVVVLEKTNEAGKKILISGGTRCNVLPQAVDVAEDYFTESSRSALRSVFGRWSLEECHQWLSSEIGIKMALEEETGKLFPASNSAAEVRDKLVAACRLKGVKFIMPAAIKELHRPCDGASSWECVMTENSAAGDVFGADRVVMATGGKSFPTLGTVGTGYQILQSLGHSLHLPYPALTPLLGGHPGGEVMPGISVANCELSVQPAAGGAQQKKKKKKATTTRRTAMLLTHRGFSGPAILDLSHNYVMAHERGEVPPALSVSWVRDVSRTQWEELIAGQGSAGSASVVSVLRHQGLPARLAEALCAEAGMPQGRKISEIRKEERRGLLDALSACQLHIRGHEGYPKAEVTGGGVPLSELDCATMESRAASGVHVCGELCDVHGRIGGFNFYWAWASGRLAGLGATAPLRG